MVYEDETQKMRRYLSEALKTAPLTKRGAIDAALSRFPLTEEERRNTATSGKKNILKSRLGTVFSELVAEGILLRAKDGTYLLAQSSPVVFQEARCEAEILSLLASAPSTKNVLRSKLATRLGTDKTVSEADDAKLYGMLPDILSRLLSEGTVSRKGNVYTLSEKEGMSAEKICAHAKLRADFLESLHAKGGEFFEHYLLELLKRYLTHHGKTVTDCRSTGGAEDGGIDGILSTSDVLGFREKIMVQAKNRNDRATEREVRGFYGAVCAADGSRGIFATTSGFCPSAKEFLDAVDNCVGIDGYRIFDMALETAYGIRKKGGVLSVDKTLLS